MSVLLLMLGASIFYITVWLQQNFDTQRYAQPARVYAKPLALFNGKRLSLSNLTAHLTELEYRQVSHTTAPGQFTVMSQQVRLFTRSFHLADLNHSAKLLVFEIVDNKLRKLVSVDKKGRHAITGLLHLEPLRIATIYPKHKQDREVVRIQQVPEILIDTLLAVEDKYFYQHYGLSVKGIIRALIANVQAGHTVEGGSTLTQQLVKNAIVGRQRSLWRKLREALTALVMEWHYPKQDILEAYLNEIYLGQQGARAIHGVALASRYYFGKSVQALTLPDVALLVAMIKGPSYYNPWRHPDRAKRRRNLVLAVLAEQQIITQKQQWQAKQVPINLHRKAQKRRRFPGFIDLVKRQLRRDYPQEQMQSQGLNIFTTLDLAVQAKAEAALEQKLAQLAPKQAALQGAVVVTDPDSGEVLALVAGRKAGFAGFNRALNASRPIGSLVKPAIYLSALEQPEKYHLLSLLSDQAITLKLDHGQSWSPRNFDRKTHGAVPLATALAKSFNLSAVQLGLELGLDKVAQTLKRLGINKKIPKYPSLLLGALNLSPFEVTGMYQTLANGGYRIPLKAVTVVSDAQGKLIQRYPIEAVQAFSNESVFLVNSALAQSVSEGTAASLKKLVSADIKLAGKTGTTDDQRDSWFAGFNDHYLAVVWLGRDDNAPTHFTGSSGALPVWGALMQSLHATTYKPVVPAGIEFSWMIPQTQLSLAAGCERALYTPFITGYLPAVDRQCSSETLPSAKEKKKGILSWLKGLFSKSTAQ